MNKKLPLQKKTYTYNNTPKLKNAYSNPIIFKQKNINIIQFDMLH